MSTHREATEFVKDSPVTRTCVYIHVYRKASVGGGTELTGRPYLQTVYYAKGTDE
jgi:hypothetical protein